MQTADALDVSRRPPSSGDWEFARSHMALPGARRTRITEPQAHDRMSESGNLERIGEPSSPKRCGRADRGTSAHSSTCAQACGDDGTRCCARGRLDASRRARRRRATS